MRLLALIYTLLLCACIAIPKGVNYKRIGMKDKMYSKKDMIFELDSLQKMLEHIHPNIYHTRSKEEIVAAYQDLVAKMPTLMSRNLYYFYFASFLAEYKDGHVNAYPMLSHSRTINRNFLAKGKLFPLEVYGLNHELFVTNVWDNRSEIIKGDILLTINGLNADSLYNVIKHAKSGNENFQHYYSGKDFRYLVAMMNINAPFIVKYKSAKDGSIREVKEKGIIEANIHDNEWRTGREEYLDTCQYFSFKIINNDIAYIKFHSLAGRAVYKGTLREHLNKDFKIIQKRNIQKLIIDMRDNTGGFVKNVDYMLSYLTENDFTLVKKIGEKASYETGRIYAGMRKNDAERLEMRFYNRCIRQSVYYPLDSIYYNTCITDTIQYGKNRFLFKGKSCFLIGPGTFSAANLTAAVVKDHQLSTLIGESTDEPVNDYGGAFTFYLPKSRLPFIVPTASFYSPTRPENDKSKVIPDIEVKPDRNTLIKGEDAALNKAIEWINQ